MESKLKKLSVDSWWRVNAVIIETVEALETRYSTILSGSKVIFYARKYSGSAQHGLNSALHKESKESQ